MVTVTTNPAPHPRLVEALVDLIDPGTPAHEAADPALPPGVVALVVTAAERLLVVAGSDVTPSEAAALAEHAGRLDAALLALVDRSEAVRGAVREWINGPERPGERARTSDVRACERTHERERAT